jgi:hypothetical protein
MKRSYETIDCFGWNRLQKGTAAFPEEKEKTT